MADRFSSVSRLSDWRVSADGALRDAASPTDKAAHETEHKATNLGGGPPSIIDYARAIKRQEYNAGLQATTTTLPPPRSLLPARPVPAHAAPDASKALNFGSEYERFARGPGFNRAPPQFQRRTLIDTFVERDDTYWQTRVTLKIDVPFTDHSHIIGRQGKNTQKVMKETQCHIHFPDSNKNLEMEKSNQVSIAGPPAMVETARHRIRQLAPLTVTFELKNKRPDVDMALLVNHPALETATGTEDLHVLVRHNRSSGQPFALIRGSVHQRDLIKQAALNLMGLVFYPGTQVLCSTALEILQPQQDAVKGPGNVHVQLISHRTGAAIHFPDVARTGASSFFIQGTLDAILAAREHIVGCLPVFIMFELDMDQPGADMDLPRLEHTFHCTLSIKVKKSMDAKTCVIRTLESNLNKAYALRRELLSSGSGGPKTVAMSREPIVICPDYEFMSDLLQPAHSFNAYEPAWMHQGPVVPGVLQQTVPLPHHPVQQHHFLAHFPTNGAHFSADLSVAHPPTAASNSVCSISLDDRPALKLPMNHGSCNLLAASTPSAPLSPFRAPHPTPTQSNFPLTPRANLGPQLANLGPDTDVETDSPMAASFSKAAARFENKAPGSGRRLRFADYEEAKIQATRQMQSQPNGTRYPSNAYSGLGFSKTFNDSKLRAAGLGSSTNGLDHTIAAFATLNADDKASLTDSDTVDDTSTERSSQLPTWSPLENSPPAERKRRAFAETTHFDAGMGGHRGGAGVVDLKEVEAAYARTQDLAELLSLLKMSKYVDIFAAEEVVDLDTFLSLEDGDLRQMGVTTVGARRKLTMIQKFLRQLHCA